MERLLLTASERKEFGKGAMGRLRKEGKIPAVIYGQDRPLHVSLEQKDFIAKFRHISDKTIVPLMIDGKKMEIIIKEFQHDIVRDTVLHVDLYQLIRTELIKVNVPVKIIGEAIGLREGGVVVTKTLTVEAECMARFVPKSIEIDVTPLKVGDTLTVGQMKMPENVKVLTAKETVLVIIETPTMVDVAVEE